MRPLDVPAENPQSNCSCSRHETVPHEKVVPYLKAGVREIGENRVQEALGNTPLPVKHVFI